MIFLNDFVSVSFLWTKPTVVISSYENDVFLRREYDYTETEIAYHKQNLFNGFSQDTSLTEVYDILGIEY